MLFWAFITLTPVISRPFNGLPHAFMPVLWHFLLVNSIFAVQFYFNAFFLIPVVLKKNIGLYFALLLLLLVVFDLVIGQVRPHPPFSANTGDQGRHPPFGFDILPLLAITGFSFAYRYLADQFKIINNKHNITNAALVSELALLRSQISPHFIFNVINSVVALSRLNPVSVEPTLIQLSKLMRYMLYINDREQITLQQKEDYLRSYIELQQLRFQKGVKVDHSFKINAPDKTLEPMLLIPFVENAFKHGSCNVPHAFIDITLLADNDILVFIVENTYDPLESAKEESHGIGLNNVKRRLELLYPNKHRLNIVQANNTYKVNLQINLK